MGWNSWDAYGLTITEAQYRDNVAVLATALKPYGWQYAVIDEGWFMDNPAVYRKGELHNQMDEFGRFVPSVARFPSAAADHGFTQLAKDVHAAGLRFGIHIVHGIPRTAVEQNLAIEGSAFHAADAGDKDETCRWDPTNYGVKDNAAGQAYYDSMLRLYASWGVDLLKVDCISYDPYKASEIRMIHKAIEKTGRRIVLSLSPGPTALENAAEVAELSQMWRMSGDIWDMWHSDANFPWGIGDQFAKTAAWAKYTKAGAWPDADMLPLGQLKPSPGWGSARQTRLTMDEQKTQLTLWSMARSPLMIGANLTLLDAFTTSLLVNRDVLHVDQAAIASRQVAHDGDIVVWTSDLPGRERALAVFNVGSAAATLDVDFARYGLGHQKYQVRDAWEGRMLGRVSEVHGVVLPSHGCVLYVLRPGGPMQEDLLGE
jgi:alpha-galactosidase